MKSEIQLNNQNIRLTVSEPPKGLEKLKWFGPALLWALSSLGTGTVLFSPRVGARYGYSLLWIAPIIIFFQWIWIREIARFTIVSGQTIFNGIYRIPGPRGWALWFIVIPQFFAAIFSVSGISALLGSALILVLPGGPLIYSMGVILLLILLVVFGKYKNVERTACLFSGFLVTTAIVTALTVLSDTNKIRSGIVPSIPSDFDIYFVLPWIGFMLAGAAGVLWYSYWVAARGFGGGLVDIAIVQHANTESIYRLKKWLSLLKATSALAVISAGLTMLSFFVLGAELLHPVGRIPSGFQVVSDLTKLLDEVWGRPGYWIVILGVCTALSGSILANQDGWGRSFADAAKILSKGRLSNTSGLKNFFSISVTAFIPIVILLIVQDPLPLLSIAGIITAIHMPVIVLFTLYVNKSLLPKSLGPSPFISFTMLISSFVYILLALFFLLRP